MSESINETAPSRTEALLRHIFFEQERIGKDGVPFTIYKIRTMVHGACNNVPESILQHGERSHTDDRIIPTRKWMRRIGFDELPQIINILKGEMVVCGPRPLMSMEFSNNKPKQQERRKRVKPGLTGGYPFYGKGRKNRTIRECEDIYLFLRERIEREEKSTIAFHAWVFAHTVRAVLQGANR